MVHQNKPDLAQSNENLIAWTRILSNTPNELVHDLSGALKVSK